MRLRASLQVLCVGLVIWITGALPAYSATRRVVLLYDERPELPGLALLHDEFVRTIATNSEDTIEVYNEAMDLSRFGSPGYEALFRDFLRSKYADKKIDVAVAILRPALEFLLSHHSTIFPGAKIVVCCFDSAELGSRSLPPDVRGVLVKREFAPTVDLALNLHPDTEQVVVVAGSSDFDKGLLEQAKTEFRPYEERLAFRYLTTLALHEILAEVAKLPPRTIVLFITLFQDGTGHAFIPHDVVGRISTAASAPTYGFVDQYVGRGIVGGSLYSFSEHGTEAAKLALEAMAGIQPSKQSVAEVQTAKLLFDWQQLQRWGISENRLPPGSEIYFRNPTIWDQYRLQVLGVFAALLLQAALITWLLYEHRRRHLAEVRARNAMSELTHMNRVATAGELSASIAHEVKQPLTGIVARAGAARNWLASQPPNVEKVRAALEQIEAAGHRANEIVTNVRSLFRKDTQDKSEIDINKLIWTVLGLVYIDLRKHLIELDMNLDDRLPFVRGNQVQLQQVLLNLVMNAIDSMRSMQPRVLSVRSVFNGHDRVHVSVEDTGTGIDPSVHDQIFKPLYTTKEHGMGMGLSICQSIIENHDGRIWVSAAASRGSIFQFELPVSVTKT